MKKKIEKIDKSKSFSLTTLLFIRIEFMKESYGFKEDIVTMTKDAITHNSRY